MVDELGQDLLRELFDYHEDGYLVNKIDRGRTAKAGHRAGSKKDIKSYRQIRLNGKPYREHRLIWMWHYGEWPSGVIDHIDHDRHNNRIENLRDISHKNNIRHGNSRQAGIYFNESNGRWHARITVNCRSQHLGCFSSYEEALSCRKQAEKELWNGAVPL